MTRLALPAALPSVHGAHGAGTATEGITATPSTTAYSLAAAGSGAAPWKAIERCTVGGSAEPPGQRPASSTTRTSSRPRAASTVSASTRRSHAFASQGSSVMVTGRMMPL